MMRRLVLLSLASALFTTLAAAATDAKLVSLLDPQTRVIAGLNGTAVKASPFGQYLLSQSAKADLSHFIASTGFDPRTNLQQVLFGSAGDANNSQRILLVKGTFVPAQVLTYGIKKGATASSYRGINVAEFPASQGKNGKPQPARWLAFLGSTRAAFGTPQLVQRAIDRYVDNTAADAGVASRIAAASGKYDAWYVSTVPGPEVALSLPQSSNELTGLAATALQSVQSEMVGVKFSQGGSVQGQAVTSSDQEALSLADRIRYMASVAATQASQKQKPTAASLIQKVSLTTQGVNVNWSVQVPESQLETLAQAHHKHQSGQ
jgi:hypothetical protein